MNKKIILPFVAILVLAVAMVGAASAAETVDKVEVRGEVVTNAGNPALGWWDATNFAAFWYDLDDNLQTESLTYTDVGGSTSGPLSNTVRTIDAGELEYFTAPVLQTFVFIEEEEPTAGIDLVVDEAEDEVVDIDGDVTVDVEECYAVVGWMAEKYIGVSGRADTLAKLLVEFDATDKKTLSTGEEWDLGGGFSLTAQQIDLEGNKVWLQLSKNGKEIDSEIIGRNNPTDQDLLYVVTEDVGDEKDVPIFVAYVDAVFRGTDSNIVQLKYVWLMSDEAIEIDSGDDFGEFEAVQATDIVVRLTNKDNAITLSPDDVIDLFGDVKFKTADDPAVLRFYPFVEKTEPGTYEIRGEVVTNAGNPALGWWDATNFAAFWYDIDDNLQTESLTYTDVGGSTSGPLSNTVRTIDAGELEYFTAPVLQTFVFIEEEEPTAGIDLVVDEAEDEVVDIDGDVTVDVEECYAVVGWMAEKYIGVSGRADTLAKLLVEFDATDKKTLSTGEEWDLGGGFSLTAQQIDLEGNKVWLQLSKNGKEIDSEIIGRNNPTDQDLLYVVTEDVGDEKDVPIFVAYVDAVFRGTDSNIVQLKYVWLMSDEAIEIDSGDDFGEFEAVQATDIVVRLTNKDNAITLSPDDVIDLFGDVKFKTADDPAVLRFYPFKEVTIGEGVAPADDEVETPTDANETADVNVTPTAVVTPTPEEAASPVVTATAEDTTAAEETATDKKTPGFEAVFAIAGLLAVAYLVLRQRE